jgi:hypothetical protein
MFSTQPPTRTASFDTQPAAPGTPDFTGPLICIQCSRLSACWEIPSLQSLMDPLATALQRKSGLFIVTGGEDELTSPRNAQDVDARPHELKPHELKLLSTRAGA